MDWKEKYDRAKESNDMYRARLEESEEQNEKLKEMMRTEVEKAADLFVPATRKHLINYANTFHGGDGKNDKIARKAIIAAARRVLSGEPVVRGGGADSES